VDFSLHATRNRGSATMLAGETFLPQGVADQVAPLVQRSAIWKRLREFAKPWVANFHRLQAQSEAHEPRKMRWKEGIHGVISDLWLEFDASERLGTPEPSVFIGLDPQLQQMVHELNPGSASPLYSYFSISQVHGVLAGILSHPFSMLQSPLPPEVARHLAFVLMQIPSTCPIYQVGLWLTRNPDKVRLVIETTRSNLEEVLTFLRAIEWPGDVDRLRTLVKKLTKVATSGVYAAVDVGPSTGPKLGLESYVKAMESIQLIEEHQEEWIQFLDWLRLEGWVTEAKRAAHLNYIGMGQQVSDKGLFKTSIDGTPEGNTTMVRKINHIKLVLEEDQVPSEVKLYTWVPLTRTRAWKAPPDEDPEWDSDDEHAQVDEEHDDEEEDEWAREFEEDDDRSLPLPTDDEL